MVIQKLGEKRMVLLKWLTIAFIPISTMSMLGSLAARPFSTMPDPATFDIVFTIGLIVVPLWIGWRAKISLRGRLGSAGVWIIMMSCLSLVVFLMDFFSSI